MLQMLQAQSLNGPSLAYAETIITSLVFTALLWALCYIIYFWSDKALVNHTRAGVPCNADVDWLYRAFTYSRTALRTLAACAVALLAFGLMH
jgi:hypothetical protein